jgi:hypothetical protein
MEIYNNEITHFYVSQIVQFCPIAEKGEEKKGTMLKKNKRKIIYKRKYRVKG